MLKCLPPAFTAAKIRSPVVWRSSDAVHWNNTSAEKKKSKKSDKTDKMSQGCPNDVSVWRCLGAKCTSRAWSSSYSLWIPWTIWTSTIWIAIAVPVPTYRLDFTSDMSRYIIYDIIYILIYSYIYIYANIFQFSIVVMILQWFFNLRSQLIGAVVGDKILTETELQTELYFSLSSDLTKSTSSGRRVDMLRCLASGWKVQRGKCNTKRLVQA